MKNQIIKTATKGKEYFGYNDTDIVVSSKKHPDINAHIGAIEKKGMLETISHVPIANIQSIKYNEKNPNIVIKHLKNAKMKTFKLAFDSAETRNAVAADVGGMKGLSKNFTPENKIKPLLINGFIIAMVLLFTVALAGIANDAANGEVMEEFSGRRSGLKNLMATAATALGPIGVGIIGALGTIFMVSRTAKRWKNPANDVLMS